MHLTTSPAPFVWKSVTGWSSTWEKPKATQLLSHQTANGWAVRSHQQRLRNKNSSKRDKSFWCIFCRRKITDTFSCYLGSMLVCHCFSNGFNFTVNTSRARFSLTCKICPLGVPFSTFSRELSLVSAFPGCLREIKDNVLCMCVYIYMSIYHIYNQVYHSGN